MSNLTELVKARVDVQLKRELEAYAKTIDRSEGAIVRAALRAYLPKRKGK
jgi:predicted transcriptional regulator